MGSEMCIRDRDSTLTIDKLASKMQVSKRNLFYKVKELIGLTPAKYVKEVRLSKAKAFIEKGDKISVKELCYSVGFRKPDYFSMLFKEKFGVPPSQYLHFSGG